MSQFRQSVGVLCLVAGLGFISAQAQPAPVAAAKTVLAATNLVPPLPLRQSPVTFFRQLLLMSPAERIHSLTNRPPEARERIMAKVREYMVLPPDERELRLRATELRWFLTPLLRSPSNDREAQLAGLPPELRDLARSRLTQWDLLAPPLQREFLTNDQTLHYFAQPFAASTNSAAPPTAGRLEQFLAFTPLEKQRILGTLSEPERARMAKTLDTFQQLPPQQRRLCLRNYAKFAGLSPAERADFLKNAESWSKMSPQERQAWRDLVANVQLWPPMPSPTRVITPPMPIRLPVTLKPAKPSMATN
jgi:hypothetical protein